MNIPDFKKFVPCELNISNKTIDFAWKQQAYENKEQIEIETVFRYMIEEEEFSAFYIKTLIFNIDKSVDFFKRTNYKYKNVLEKLSRKIYFMGDFNDNGDIMNFIMSNIIKFYYDHMLENKLRLLGEIFLGSPSNSPENDLTKNFRIYFESKLSIIEFLKKELKNSETEYDILRRYAISKKSDIYQHIT